MVLACQYTISQCATYHGILDHAQVPLLSSSVIVYNKCTSAKQIYRWLSSEAGAEGRGPNGPIVQGDTSNNSFSPCILCAFHIPNVILNLTCHWADTGTCWHRMLDTASWALMGKSFGDAPPIIGQKQHGCIWLSQALQEAMPQENQCCVERLHCKIQLDILTSWPWSPNWLQPKLPAMESSLPDQKIKPPQKCP